MVLTSSLGELMEDQMLQDYQIMFNIDDLSEECGKNETQGHRHYRVIYISLSYI